MDEHAFFFSYARRDWDASHVRDPLSPAYGKNLIDALFEDLRGRVQGKLGCRLEHSGYRDQNELQEGEIWSEQLATAVCRSKVLVALLTPNYLRSLSCGREFAVFLRRYELLDLRGINKFYHILPIYWESSTHCAPHFPEKTRKFFRDVQQTRAGLPKRYPAIIGYRDTWETGAQSDHTKILVAAAERIVAMINDCVLPPLVGFDRFGDLPSAFDQTDGDRERVEEAGRPVNLVVQPHGIQTPRRPLPILASP